jgi:hypothetical protein
MVQVWHPDRFATNPRLQKMAQEKLCEINEAYEKLRTLTPAGVPAVASAKVAASSPPVTHPVPRAVPVWLYLGAPGIGVVAAIFMVIISARSFYSFLTVTSAPVAVSVARSAAPAPEQPETPPAPRRAPVIAARSSATETRISNGYEITEPRGRPGVGRVSVNNQTEQDAIASLLESGSGMVLRTVYIGAGMKVVIDGIGPGVYRLTLHSGSEWSQIAGGFTRNRTSPRSVGPLTFMQVQTAERVQGDQYSIVLRHDATLGAEMAHAGM